MWKLLLQRTAPMEVGQPGQQGIPDACPRVRCGTRVSEEQLTAENCVHVGLSQVGPRSTATAPRLLYLSSSSACAGVLTVNHPITQKRRHFCTRLVFLTVFLKFCARSIRTHSIRTHKN